MNDLIELARGEEPRADAEDVRLDLLVERGRRARPPARARHARCHVELEPTIIAGVPARLERAVGNLIDNAVKYSPPGEPVEVALRERRADRARPRAGDLRRGPAARLRPLLPRRRGARAPRLGAGPRDRAPGRRPAGRQRHRRAGARRRHADAPAPARRRGARAAGALERDLDEDARHAHGELCRSRTPAAPAAQPAARKLAGETP